jgi:hypothetical protein
MKGSAYACPEMRRRERPRPSHASKIRLGVGSFSLTGGAAAEQWEDELQKRRERSGGGKDASEAGDKPSVEKAAEKPEDGKESKEGMFEGLKRTLLRNLVVEIRCETVRGSRRHR